MKQTNICFLGLYLTQHVSKIYSLILFECSTLGWVVNEALLLKEDIDSIWFFAANVNFEDNTNICDIAIKCKYLLMEFQDFQLHALMVKLGRIVNPHDDNGNVKKVMHTAISNGKYFYILALHFFFYCSACHVHR
jgi:hypothetical protein